MQCNDIVNFNNANVKKLIFAFILHKIKNPYLINLKINIKNRKY